MKTFLRKIWHAMVAHKVLTIFTAIAIVGIVVSFSILGVFVWSRYSRGIVPTDAQIAQLKANGQVYEHVVIFGVDGAGGYFDKMDTPGFDSVFKNDKLDSSVTYTALSQFPTESGYNWGSMIHGVRNVKHKLDNHNTTNQKYTDTKYPSFFKVYAERHPDSYMVSIVDWANINVGIIEDLPQVEKINPIVVPADTWTESEKLVDTAVCEETINQIKNNDPTIVFTHFDCVDAAGHSYGWGKPEYIDAMKHVDNLIGQIYQACVEQGWENNTLFMCVSDHGHMNNGGHGGNQYIVRNVVFAVAGGKGNIINGTPEYVVTQDVASVVLYALGEKQPSSWESRVPKNIFKGLK